MRLGVAMLKATTGAGLRVRDVKEDMVIARGLGGLDCAAGAVEVQTTTEWGSRRITARSCSDMGRDSVVDECGWMDGGTGGSTFQVCLSGVVVWKHLVGTTRRLVSNEPGAFDGDLGELAGIIEALPSFVWSAELA